MSETCGPKTEDLYCTKEKNHSGECHYESIKRVNNAKLHGEPDNSKLPEPISRAPVSDNEAEV